METTGSFHTRGVDRQICEDCRPFQKVTFCIRKKTMVLKLLKLCFSRNKLKYLPGSITKIAAQWRGIIKCETIKHGNTSRQPEQRPAPFALVRGYWFTIWHSGSLFSTKKTAWQACSLQEKKSFVEWFDLKSHRTNSESIAASAQYTKWNVQPATT